MLGDRPRWGPWTDGMGIDAAAREVLGAAAARVCDRLREFGAGPERFGLIHADMRLGNLLVDGQDFYVIDFDDCGFGWHLYDLGTAVSFLEHDPRVPEWCDSWVRGYRTVRTLPRSDADEIPTFVMLRRLMLVAWIGSHSSTDLAQEMGQQYTDVSCELAENYLTATKGH
jgi:Ser/Thr protein kinase RdoA (MazF antagonist)